MPEAPQGTTFTVLGGPYKGTRLVVDDAVDEVLIGSDSGCRLSLDTPGVSPIHARIWVDTSGVTVFDTHSAQGLYVNDSRVLGQSALKDGDIVWLGEPGGPDSVMIQFRGGPATVPAAEPPAAPPAAMEERIAEPEPDATDPFVVDPPFADTQAGEPAPEVAGRAEAPAFGGESLDFLVDDPASSFSWEPGMTGGEPGPTGGEPPPPAPEPVQTVDEPSEPAWEFGQTEDEPPPSVAKSSAAESLDFLVDEAPPAPAADEDVFFVEDDVVPAASTPLPPPSPAVPPATPPAPSPAVGSGPPPPSAARLPSDRAPRPSASAVAPARPAAAGVSPSAATPAPARPRRPPSPAPARPAAARAQPKARGRAVPILVVLAVLGVGAAVAYVFLQADHSVPEVQAAEPSRVRPGETIVLTGAHFSRDPARNVVKFEGGRPGTVRTASETRLEVEVPDIPAVPGRPNRVPLTVMVDGRESSPFDISVYEAPNVHGLSPSVAMPGDEVTLAGTGWGPGATVAFGSTDAQVLEVTPTSIRVRVPALSATPGTSAPVMVSMGGERSKPAPFVIGRLPLVLSVQPPTATAGDLVTLNGRGFQIQPAANDVRFGGRRALVVSAADSEAKVVVPWPAPEGGNTAVEVRVPGSAEVGRASVALAPLPDPLELRFVAEPFEDAPGHGHAVLATALGPAFVLTASGGQSAGARALEAQRRLNDAAAALKATAGLEVEARDLGSRPTVALVGRPEPLLEVTEEDAAAYNEDWMRSRGRTVPVTRARLAVWWAALARDLTLLFARGEKPRHALALAPEGRALLDAQAVAAKAGPFGVPRAVLVQLRPPQKEALRALGLRVPAAVAAPAGSAVDTPVAAASAVPSPSPAAFKLEGDWTGWEVEGGERRFVTINFQGTTGTLSYQRALTLSLPLAGLEQGRRGSVRYQLQTARGPRYYVGQWDGQKIAGTIAADPEGKTPLGTFTLERAR